MMKTFFYVRITKSMTGARDSAKSRWPYEDFDEYEADNGEDGADYGSSSTY